LVQQGQGAKLPDSEEVAADAAKAEEMLAQLEADNELASSVGGIASGSSMSAEEQALFDELERESGGGGASAVTEKSQEEPAAEAANTTPATRTPVREPAAPAKTVAESTRKTAEPEAG
jgi:hypothetical protein